MRSVGRLCCGLVLALCVQTPAVGQIIGPGPAQGDLELGGWWAFSTYQKHWTVERIGTDEEYDGPVWKGQNAALTLRYGITNGWYMILNFGTAQHSSDFLNSRNGLMGVLGIGGNVRVTRLRSLSLRVSGQYNDLFTADPSRPAGIWRGHDADVVVAVDRTLKWNQIEINVAPGIEFHRGESRYLTLRRVGGTIYLDEYDVVRGRELHEFRPVMGVLLTAFSRVRAGLQLTFGPASEWRWFAGVRL